MDEKRQSMKTLCFVRDASASWPIVPNRGSIRCLCLGANGVASYRGLRRICLVRKALIALYILYDFIDIQIIYHKPLHVISCMLHYLYYIIIRHVCYICLYIIECIH